MWDVSIERFPSEWSILLSLAGVPLLRGVQHPCPSAPRAAPPQIWGQALLWAGSRGAPWAGLPVLGLSCSPKWSQGERLGGYCGVCGSDPKPTHLPLLTSSQFVSEGVDSRPLPADPKS